MIFQQQLNKNIGWYVFGIKIVFYQILVVLLDRLLKYVHRNLFRRVYCTVNILIACKKVSCSCVFFPANMLIDRSFQMQVVSTNVYRI